MFQKIRTLEAHVAPTRGAFVVWVDGGVSWCCRGGITHAVHAVRTFYSRYSGHSGSGIL